jgi:hypothetical protein
LGGESVCYYLTCSGKAGAAERFADDAVFQACLALLQEIRDKHPAIGRRVDKSAISGFRGNHLRGNKKL